MSAPQAGEHACWARSAHNIEEGPDGRGRGIRCQAEDRCLGGGGGVLTPAQEKGIPQAVESAPAIGRCAGRRKAHTGPADPRDICGRKYVDGQEAEGKGSRKPGRGWVLGLLQQTQTSVNVSRTRVEADRLAGRRQAQMQQSTEFGIGGAGRMVREEEREGRDESWCERLVMVVRGRDRQAGKKGTLTRQRREQTYNCP